MTEESRYNSIPGNVLEVGVAAMLIVQCRTMWMHLHDYGMMVNRVAFVVLAICLAGLIIMSNPERNLIRKVFCRERKQYCIVIAVAAYVGIFILMNSVNSARVLRCGIIVALMFVLMESDSSGEGTGRILTKYCDLITGLAAITLVFWIAFSVLKIVPPFVYTVQTDWSETLDVVNKGTFMHIYYETQWLVWGLPRNTGIFTEAPMASFNYSLALMLDVLILKRTSRIRMGILIAAIATTFSATGYILVLMLFGYHLIFDTGWYNRKKAHAKVMLTVLAGLILFVMVWFLWVKIKWGSGNIRINDFVIGFQAWLAHPIWGGGFENLEYLQSFMPGWREMNCGYSNSPLQILAQGGVYLAAPYVACHIIGIKNGLKNHNYSLLMFILLLMISTILTSVPYQYCLFYVLLMLAYSNRVVPGKDRNTDDN